MIDRGDELNESLEKAAALLREKPPVSSEWREALIARIERPERVPVVRERRWSVRPFSSARPSTATAMCGASSSFTSTMSQSAPDFLAIIRTLDTGCL